MCKKIVSCYFGLLALDFALSLCKTNKISHKKRTPLTAAHWVISNLLVNITHNDKHQAAPSLCTHLQYVTQHMKTISLCN